MAAITKITKTLLGTVLAGMVSTPVYADLSLRSAAMSISVNETTGAISKVAMKTGGNTAADEIQILNNGNLLSLGGLRPAMIRMQKK